MQVPRAPSGPNRSSTRLRHLPPWIVRRPAELDFAAVHGSNSLWYLTRATAVLALVLLSAVVVLGITASVGRSSRRWPRFFSQALHRDLSLLCLALISLHVLTTVLDGFVPLGFLDAVMPFHSASRQPWQGLGALSFDLFLALGITSAVRQRIGYRMWRVVHWLAYLCWPFAVFHGLGAGTDTRLEPVLVIDAVCVSAVVAATGCRLAARWRGHGGRRLLGGLSASVVTASLVSFVALGPLQAVPSRSTFSPISAGSASDGKGRHTGRTAQPNATGQRGPSVAASAPTGPSPAQSNQPASGPSGTSAPSAGSGQANHIVPAAPTPSLPRVPAPTPPTLVPPSIHLAPPSLGGSTGNCEHGTICLPRVPSVPRLPGGGAGSHW